MSAVVDDDDDRDPAELSRKELQAALRANKISSGGTNDQLRQRYATFRIQKQGGVAIDLTDNGVSSTTPLSAPAASVSAATAATAATATATSKVLSNAKKAINKTPEAEDRDKRYRSKCPIAVRDRIERATKQRMFLVTKDENADMEALSCNFVVLGSTGNVYNVKIKRVPHCTCPDHARGNLCKHILFVLLKVMALPSESPLIYQAAWTKSELEEMFLNMRQRFNHVSGSVLANDSVRRGYAKLKGEGEVKDDEEEDGKVSGVARRTDDEDCPICFDPLEDASKTTYCRVQCGANFHQDCIRNWLQQHRSKPTCPMCRGPWEDPSIGGKKSGKSEAYANLSQLSGQSLKRDTSTYHFGGGYYQRRR